MPKTPAMLRRRGEDAVRDMVANPIYALDILGEGEIVTRDLWVEVNLRAIEQEGAETWLRRLMANLERDLCDERSTHRQA